MRRSWCRSNQCRTNWTWSAKNSTNAPINCKNPFDKKNWITRVMSSVQDSNLRDTKKKLRPLRMTINDFYRNCRSTEQLKTEMCRHWKRKIVTWGNSRVSGLKRDSWVIHLKTSWFHSGVSSTRMMMWRGNWRSVKQRWWEKAMKPMTLNGTIWPWGMKSSLSNSLATT